MNVSAPCFPRARIQNAFALFGLFLTLASSSFAAEWVEGEGFRSRILNVGEGGKTGFTLLSASETGLIFTNLLGEWEGAANRVLQNGSGVALGDYDGDGLPDIYLCNLNGENALFHNLGNWHFTNVTAQAKVGLTNRLCRGAVFADIDGDSKPDLLVAVTGGGVLCFHNEGGGIFANTTDSAGTASVLGTTGMALGDVDGNGTLDLYVVNNRTDDIRDQGKINLQMVRGKISIPSNYRDRLVVVDGRVNEYGDPDILFLNDGKGRFKPVDWTNGFFLSESGEPLAHAPLDWGLTASFRDVNGDGRPDLYVCNDYWTPDRFWLNDGNGHYRAIAPTAVRRTSASSMGVDFADIDRDGNVDFMVVDMLSRIPAVRKRQVLAQKSVSQPIGLIENRPQVLQNTLQHNRGDGTFADIAQFSGLAATEWSWCPYFIDVDLDGYEDLLISAGHFKDVQDMDAGRKVASIRDNFSNFTDAGERHKAFISAKVRNDGYYPDLFQPLLAFRNSTKLTFEEVTNSWGTDQPGVHHALAYADLDGDGDLDLVVNNLRSPAAVYRNDSTAGRVAVRLRGTGPNSQGIGATVKLLNGAVPMQSQEVVSGGRYMGGCDPMLVFASGRATGGMTIVVSWRTGGVQTIQNVDANRLYEIDELRPASAGETHPALVTPFFADVSPVLGHTHHENEFNDLERQPLLWKKLSQMGPGLAAVDLDSDGFDDLIIGTGKGGAIAFMQNDRRGGFTNAAAQWALGPEMRDVTAIIDTGIELLFALSNYEDGAATGAAVRSLQKTSPLPNRASGATSEAPPASHWTDIVPASESSPGPLASADVTGAGEWWLFVGGAVVPGKYPTAASSRIFVKRDSQWKLDVENSAVLHNVGLVQSALFTDLDGDGRPELLLATDWGPLRIFKIAGGKLTESTASLKLDQLAGWWTGLAVGDFDEDGRLDIVAGNWGLNSSYRATQEFPLKVYFSDIAGTGLLDVIETEYQAGSKLLAPRRPRDVLASYLPWISERFPSYKSFSEAALSQVLADHEQQFSQLSATTLATTVLLNRGDHFIPIELPFEAQLAPAFSVNVADLDGDGHDDIFLSQNFFATAPEVPRLDAGRSLWLRGNGKGDFTAVPGQVSGLIAYGEQRSAVLADFDHDGRTDLVLGQNGAPTLYFKNVKAKPGLRVRVTGPPHNPAGIGARVRLEYQGQRFSPMREVHSGSGFLAQDSFVQIFGIGETPKALEIVWPGGIRRTIPIMPHQESLSEIEVKF